MRPWPRTTKLARQVADRAAGGRVWTEVNQIAAPEKNIIVVSVTMKGGMLSRVMQAPLKAPISAADGEEGQHARGHREPGPTAAR